MLMHSTRRASALMFTFDSSILGRLRLPRRIDAFVRHAKIADNILLINNANETQCSAFCITYKIPNAQEMPINQFAKDKHSAVPRDGSRRDRVQTR